MTFLRLLLSCLKNKTHCLSFIVILILVTLLRVPLFGQQDASVVLIGDTIVVTLDAMPNVAVQWQTQESACMCWVDVPNADSTVLVYNTIDSDPGWKFFRALVTDTVEFIYPPFSQYIFEEELILPPDSVMVWFSVNGDFTMVQWQSQIDTINQWVDIPGETGLGFLLLTDTATYNHSIFRARCNNPHFQCLNATLKVSVNLLEEESDLQIGDKYGGGLVYSIDTLNDLARIVFKNNHGEHQWGCEGVLISGADSSGVGYGAQNTFDIVNQCQSGDIAAAVCDTLSKNGFSDWFLPSLEELQQIQSGLYYDFGANLAWSSTEYDEFSAYSVEMGAGAVMNAAKNNSLFVYPTRNNIFYRAQYFLTQLLIDQDITGYINVEHCDENSSDVFVEFTECDSTFSAWNWDFAGGIVVSGSGCGPYIIRYADGNYRRITLNHASGFCSSPVYYSDLFKVQLFQDLSLGLASIGIGNVQWIDFNNDLLLDIFMTGNDTTVVYKNNGDSTFSPIDVVFPNLSHSGSAVGDYNNDGWIDILLFGRMDSLLVTILYRNEGDFIFSEIETDFIGIMNGAAEFCDINHDGRVDVILSGEQQDHTPCTKVYISNIDFEFNEITTNLPALKKTALSCSDYNRDGNIDLLIAGNNDSIRTTNIFNINNNLFTESGVQLTGVDAGGAEWADFNNDGNMDLVISGLNSDPYPSSPNCLMYGDCSTLKFYQNHGNNVFSLSTEQTRSRAYARSSIDCCDYDTDGDTDLLVTGFPGIGRCIVNIGGGNMDTIYEMLASAPRIYRNDGITSFTDIAADIPRCSTVDEYNLFCVFGYWSAFDMVWGDYNNDGKVDILSNGNGIDGRTGTVYTNELNDCNQSPGPPINLSAVVNRDTVVFSWLHASDAETPQYGLTYNLRVGSSPGGNEIMASLADSTGWRKVPGMGNVFQNTNWYLNSLLPGKYYWSVQTVDNSFTGSLFAEESSFQIYATVTTWTGEIDRDWNNPGNWTDGIPGEITTVIIPGEPANQPIVNNSSCNKKLLLLSGSELTINPDKQLNLSDSLIIWQDLPTDTTKLIIKGNVGISR